MLILFLAMQFTDPVEAYEQRMGQRMNPPTPYYVPQQPKPPITFNRPFAPPIAKPMTEQRFIAPDGKLTTCRSTGPWVYCF